MNKADIRAIWTAVLITLAVLVGFSLAAKADPGLDQEKTFSESALGAVSDCGAKWGWATARLKQPFAPELAVRGCMDVLAKYQVWLMEIKKLDMTMASRFAVVALMGAYYGGFKAIQVDEKADEKQGKFKL